MENFFGPLTYLTLLCAGLYGYVENIIKLFHMHSIVSGEGAVRIVGVLTGIVGAIAGYF